MENIVGIGCRVRTKYFVGQSHGKKRHYEPLGEETYEIGGYFIPQNSPPNKVSYDSFIGRALMGARVGQTVKVSMGGSVDGVSVDFLLEILEITQPPSSC